jgi:hypothetical protein
LSRNIKIKIYKTVLPVVLYGCETWHFMLREENRLRRAYVITGRREEYLAEKGRSERKVENKLLMRSSIICTPHQIR